MSDPFDEDLFETRLEALKDTQDGIQQMSSWCLQHRGHHKKIVSCWLNVFKRVRVEHRLVLFYLANDVVQYSKRKKYEFVESWATALQRATTMVRDEKVKGKILRVLKIWEQREIYSEEFLSDLCGLLNINPPKKTQPHNNDSPDDFQNSTVIATMRECVQLSETTDTSFKKLPKVPNCDIETIKQQLKDKSHSDDVEKEIERYITYIEAYNKNLNAEIKSRKTLLSNLDTAIKFYANQRGEVKVVVTAYKNFGNRIKLVKKKLDEVIPNLPSPIPSPDINAPSPEPDADLQLPDDQSPISMNLFKSGINGYSSYLDGNLPFDINDFKRDDTSSSKISSQPIEVISSRSDDESYNSSIEYYKPESINTYSSGSSAAIPGLNPMPVPPVSEYESLARSAQQYNNMISSTNPPLFGNNMSSGYNPFVPGYPAENTYANNRNARNNMQQQPLMPPPPMPPSIAGSCSGADRNSNDEFNSSWDMNLPWSNLDQNTVDTPVSPPHFERESNSTNVTTIEYTEHETSLVATQDIDHRQLQITSFNASLKLGLSKDKTRQLDIDHRNLISLTGSPVINDSENKNWLSSQDQDFRTNRIGDVDYRASIPQNIKTIDSTDANKTQQSNSNAAETPPINASSPNANKQVTSPHKSTSSSSSESQKEDANSNVARYDPSDMVVDMDMSDDDLDDIFREVNEQSDEAVEKTEVTEPSDDQSAGQENCNGSIDDNQTMRPALLETPPEFTPHNLWDPASMQHMNMCNYRLESPDMNSDQEWNMQWNGNGGGVGGGGRPRAPPPPRPPFPMQFQYQNNDAEVNSIRGRGRGWSFSPQNQYRGYPRPPRGGGGASPYFNRGGGRGSIRGSFRGKFRGNNAWI